MRRKKGGREEEEEGGRKKGRGGGRKLIQDQGAPATGQIGLPKLRKEKGSENRNRGSSCRGICLEIKIDS